MLPHQCQVASAGSSGSRCPSRNAISKSVDLHTKHPLREYRCPAASATCRPSWHVKRCKPPLLHTIRHVGCDLLRVRTLATRELPQLRAVITRARTSIASPVLCSPQISKSHGLAREEGCPSPVLDALMSPARLAYCSRNPSKRHPRVVVA